MVTRVTTVAFQGIEAVPVDVQAQIAPGFPALVLVGLPRPTCPRKAAIMTCPLPWR